MYAAIVVFFASIVGVYSLSIHKRSCSVTIDSDFAVNKVRLIFCFFSHFFIMFEKMMIAFQRMHVLQHHILAILIKLFLKKIDKMQNEINNIKGYNGVNKIHIQT